MQITILYVGSSLLAPLKNAEHEINREYKLDLRVATHNFGAPVSEPEWQAVHSDLQESDVVFIIHVMDGENASRLLPLLSEFRKRHHAVIVINCMPELMRCVRMGKLDVARLVSRKNGSEGSRGLQLLSAVGSWVGRQAKGKRRNANHGQYLKVVDRLPGILRLIPNTGALQDVKGYLNVFCYFLQPTPNNIRSMLLYSLKHYVPDDRLASKRIKIPPPERSPSVAIYHPEATGLFETFGSYQKWYRGRSKANRNSLLDPKSTIGLLLMRPQVVSRTTRHYDALIRALEEQGLSVIPAISTLMDNRQACSKFFVGKESASRVSQIVSLTGFSFVGGPAMNDSAAASDFLKDLKRPYRSVVSLDMQTIESWRDSFIGLNPVQAGMQIAIPEIDGATEPFVYGGTPGRGIEPVALDDRCLRLARRIRRWNRLRVAPRSELKIAIVAFCFPPNKGNIGTAADLDVFPSIWDVLNRLHDEGYKVEVPSSPEVLREELLGGNSEKFASNANVAHLMSVDEYRTLCPYVSEIETEWGAAPGGINTFGGQLAIQGLNLSNVFIGVQPTFGFEGDPTRLMMARGSTPHHGFMAFYTYLSEVLKADVVIHVGTHGAMEFMPGKQLGLSTECWPDRLIGELPNIYLYSVNNPSEGSIAKRRSYAELISYLTPPMENAGLYKGLASLKELVEAYRGAASEDEKVRLFDLIEEASHAVNLTNSATSGKTLQL